MSNVSAALITGANRGIGAALLSRMAARGPAIGTSRSDADAPTGAEMIPLDVTHPDSFSHLSEKMAGRSISLLVCNAGVYVDKGQRLADGFDAALWEQTFSANVTGVFHTIQTLLPNVQMEPGGKIAIIASQMGSQERAKGGSYIYRASKAAAVNLGRNLAVDLAPLGIAVGIYHPGWVRTDMGGSNADIDIDSSADGLMQRFEALSLDTTGVFESYDGTPMPF